MQIVLALVIGALYAAGLYMLLRRSIVKLLLGLVLLSNAANLLILTAGGLRRGEAPIIAEDTSVLAANAPDPLPPAFILTAIVISFGVLGFTIALAHRAHGALGTDDLDQLRESDS